MLLWRAVKSGKSGAKCPLKEPSPAIAGRLSAPGTDRWRRRLRGGYVRRVGAGVSGSKSPVTPRGERKPGKNLYRTSRQFKQCNLPQKSIVGMARPPFTVWLDGHCLPWPSRLAVHARHETPGGRNEGLRHGGFKSSGSLADTAAHRTPHSLRQVDLGRN